jgi:anhydro-N-acetylmuramic acid kinase
LNIKDTYLALGVMSGTSLDGLDLALCRFNYDKKKWNYQLIKAKTFSYDAVWKKKLNEASSLSSCNLLQLDKHFGSFIGNKINHFLKGEKIDFIASHGHTVFHQPEKGITLQIGSGETIASICQTAVISDFRSMDVALGGQGAPLVPIGDEFLFSEFDYCLNLGGFSNISFREHNKRLAFDICPVNMAINKLFPPFDKDGSMARSGGLNKKLLYQLNSLPYYSLPYPKSLSREWFTKYFWPFVSTIDMAVEDKLRTVYEHIAMKIKLSINARSSSRMLITGGGAKNTFLVELIQEKFPGEITIPEHKIIDFKEAIIFAFLGVLRLRNEINCLASVTGAKRDSCGGAIHYA